MRRHVISLYSLTTYILNLMVRDIRRLIAAAISRVTPALVPPSSFVVAHKYRRLLDRH